MSDPAAIRRADSPAPARRGDFLLAACQGGAEAALCERQRLVLPKLAKGAWRRGLVTFRLPPDFDPPDDFAPDLVYARTLVRCLGQATGSTTAAVAGQAVELLGGQSWDSIHVWNRDPRADHDIGGIRAAIVTALGAGITAAKAAAKTRPGDLVLDCVVDTAERWWVGWHRAATPQSCWPGGNYPLALPADKISRAWLKLDEAIASFPIPLVAGTRAVELGAAPGGACQRLLEEGLEVVGIDPALVDQRLAGRPRFEQWRMRARDVRLKEFRGFDWVVSDMNIDPKSALESIGRVVTAPGAGPRGIIATLKLPDWSRASALPGWLGQFQSWGYAPLARQLSTGGREVCVLAIRKRSARRRPARRRPAG